MNMKKIAIALVVAAALIGAWQIIPSDVDPLPSNGVAEKQPAPVEPGSQIESGVARSEVEDVAPENATSVDDRPFGSLSVVARWQIDTRRPRTSASSCGPRTIPSWGGAS